MCILPDWKIKSNKISRRINFTGGVSLSKSNQLHENLVEGKEGPYQDERNEDKLMKKATNPESSQLEPVQERYFDQAKEPEAKQDLETNLNIQNGVKDGETAEETEKTENKYFPIKEEKSVKYGVRPASKQELINFIITKHREVLAEAMEGYTFHRKLKAK